MKLALSSALLVSAWSLTLGLSDLGLRFVGWLSPVELEIGLRQVGARALAGALGGALFGLLRTRFSDTPGGRAAAGAVAGSLAGLAFGVGAAALGSTRPILQLVPASILAGLALGTLLSAFAQPLGSRLELETRAG